MSYFVIKCSINLVIFINVYLKVILFRLLNKKCYQYHKNYFIISLHVKYFEYFRGYNVRIVDLGYYVEEDSSSLICDGKFKITSSDFDKICRFNLQPLNINISTYGKMINLQKIVLFERDVDIKLIRNLTKMTKLILIGSSINNIDYISNLTSLTKLNLGNSTVEQNAMESISKLTNLKSITIETNITSDNISSFVKLVKLEKAYFNDIEIGKNFTDIIDYQTQQKFKSDPMVEMILKMPKLKEIYSSNDNWNSQYDIFNGMSVSAWENKYIDTFHSYDEL